MKPHFPLNLLPSELLHKITNHLSTIEELSLSKVSRKFRCLVKNSLQRSRVSGMRIDFSKEVLAICQLDSKWILFLNDESPCNQWKNSEYQSTFVASVTISGVFFVGNEFIELVQKFLNRINKQYKQKPFPDLQMFLADQDIPQTFLQLMIKNKKLRINSSEISTQPPQEILPIRLSDVIPSMTVDLMLSSSQILQLSLPHISCSITTYDATVIMKKFYTESLPENATVWNFEFKGSIDRLSIFMDRVENVQCCRDPDASNSDDDPFSDDEDGERGFRGCDFMSSCSTHYKYIMEYDKKQSSLKFTKDQRYFVPTWPLRSLQAFRDIPI